jgi:hypothetical protein
MIKCIIQNEDAKDKVLLLCDVEFLYQLEVALLENTKTGKYVFGKTLREAGDW